MSTLRTLVSMTHKKIIELTSSVHLSISFAANILREAKPESQSCSSFRPLSWESVSSLLSLYPFLQGCQVAPTLLGIHISVIGAWNTIRAFATVELKSYNAILAPLILQNQHTAVEAKPKYLADLLQCTSIDRCSL